MATPQAEGGIPPAGQGVGLAQVFDQQPKVDYTPILQAEKFRSTQEAKEKKEKAKTGQLDPKLGEKMFHAHRPLFRKMVGEYYNYVRDHADDDDFEDQNATWQSKIRDFAHSSSDFNTRAKTLGTEMLKKGEGEFDNTDLWEPMNDPKSYMQKYTNSQDNPYSVIESSYSDLNSITKKAERINYVDRVKSTLSPLVKGISDQGRSYYTDEKTGFVVQVDTDNFTLEEADKLIENDLANPEVFTSAQREFDALPEETKRVYANSESPIVDYYQDTYSPYLVRDFRLLTPKSKAGGGGEQYGFGFAETDNFRFEHQEFRPKSRFALGRDVVRMARKDASENKSLIFTNPETGKAIKGIPIKYIKPEGKDWGLQVINEEDGKEVMIDKTTASPIIRANYDGFDIDRFIVPGQRGSEESGKSEEMRKKYNY